LLVVAIVNAVTNLKTNRYEKKDKMINLFTMIFLHIQLLLGLVLYATSDKVQFVEGMMANASLRFYDVEHISIMLLAIILITLGRRKAEKNPSADAKHKLILRYYLLGLILIFIAIPWPFTHPSLNAGWF
jgi:NADH:ubiquinone oxidoreductase subunit 2 (subunit N)